MLRLYESEWQIVLNAYLYEIEDQPIMSDACYDIFSELVAEQKNVNIPGFDKSTGQWIYALVETHPEIKDYAKKLRKLGEGTSILNVVPESYILRFME